MLGLQWGISLELRIGMYAGLATVGIFVIWHTRGFSRVLISVGMAPPVSHNPSSPIGGSLRFSPLIITPVMISMVSLFVLIPIKMFNPLGALLLSEDTSLVPMPPWINSRLLTVVSVSFGPRFLILHAPFFVQASRVVPLS